MGPLEGVGVLDSTILQQSPQARLMFADMGAECICSPIADYEDLVNDPQVRANDYVVEVDRLTRGRMPVVGAPWRFSQTPAKVAAAAPEPGQDTEEILQELSYSWEQIESLREQRVPG